MNIREVFKLTGRERCVNVNEDVAQHFMLWIDTQAGIAAGRPAAAGAPRGVVGRTDGDVAIEVGAGEAAFFFQRAVGPIEWWRQW